MKNLFRFLAIFLMMFSFAGLVNAEVGQTNPEKTTIRMDGIVPVCVRGGQDVPCEDFYDLIKALQGVINFIVKFVLMFTVVIIAYAGFLYMTSGSNPGNIAKANEMFLSVAKGIFFIGAAWLIVNLIMSALVREDIDIIQFLK